MDMEHMTFFKTNFYGIPNQQDLLIQVKCIELPIRTNSDVFIQNTNVLNDVSLKGRFNRYLCFGNKKEQSINEG